VAGYDPNFLPEPVPLPELRPSVAGDVLRRPELREGILADYANYTIAMHATFRTLLYAALNVDQDQFQQTARSDNWRIDSRIGAENQLDNSYYRNNPWDRGHLARRATAGWGATRRQAQRAADETFYFSNAALQHANLNQDEWLALEEWVFNLDLDKGNRFSVFSGPIFGEFMRTVRPPGRPPAFVPSAFFKIIFYMNQRDLLEVRAFLVPQDNVSLKDKNGRRIFDHQTYQVSITEIEELTGLEFPDVLPDRNPMFFNESQQARAELNVHEFPERREVNGPRDIVRDNERPRAIRFADDEVDVFIAAALVNPVGNERQNEWVSIANLTNEEVRLDGWSLVDDRQRTLELKGAIGPGEAVRIQPLSPVSLANSRGGFVQLLDDQSRQIDRVPYTPEQARREGKPIVFAYRELAGEPAPIPSPGQSAGAP